MAVLAESLFLLLRVILQNSKLRHIKISVDFLETGASTWKTKGKFKFSKLNERKDFEHGKLAKYEKIKVTTDLSVPFVAKTKIDDDDLKIYLLSKEQAPKSFDYELDANQISGNFKSNVKITNKTKSVDLGLDVYARVSESDDWVKIGTARLKETENGAGASDVVQTYLDTPNVEF